MKKTVLSIGLNDKNTKTQLIDTDDAKRITTEILAKCADGLTLYDAKGVYTHDDGQVVIENTLRVELYQELTDAIIDGIKAIKMALNQESIAVEIVENNTQFI